MKVQFAKLCQHQNPDCPILHIDDAAPIDQQVSIIDDFGKEVAMSKDQFRVLVSKSKKGELDI